jgi:hypothetical protein
MRSRVLGLYRRIFREAKVWENVAERDDIRAEAREVFRNNRDLPAAQVEQKLNEGDTRIELAKHYRIAAPRPVYAQKGTNPGDIEEKYQQGDFKGSSYGVKS